MTPTERFDQELRVWVEAHAAKRKIAPAFANVSALLATRLPAELREAIGQGFLDGALETTRGYWAGPAKEPKQAQYMLEMRGGVCAPCWEVFVLQAEGLRLRAKLRHTGLTLKHEDGAMDFTARDNHGALLGYVEMKFEKSTAESLVRAVESYGRSGIGSSTRSRSNDGLKKATYIVNGRPQYFGVHAIGFDVLFEVTYVGDDRFDLRKIEASRLEDVLGGYRGGLLP